jgi:hypothetical protein
MGEIESEQKKRLRGLGDLGVISSLFISRKGVEPHRRPAITGFLNHSLSLIDTEFWGIELERRKLRRLLRVLREKQLLVSHKVQR